MSTDLKMLRRIELWRPANRAEIAAWVLVFLGMKMPERAVCAHHQTPLDYLEHAFLEGAGNSVAVEEGGGDAVIWACRGGGKTMVGAVATLLDLLFKPKIQVRILGGSLEQSEKMYAYLRQLFERHFSHLLAAPATQRRLILKNGARVDVLAQSDRAVRGQRVQKLRCDEVELFEEPVWQAAQLTTRSLPGERPIRGAVEAFSTMHLPGGLMQKVLADAREKSGAARQVFAWCIWDVIEKCPPERQCATCPLFADCGGRAKDAEGFVPIEDVITMRSRISQATWDHEMLCKPPRFENAVFPTFRREKHVRAVNAELLAPGARVAMGEEKLRVESLVCGVDFGYRHAFVCLFIAMLRRAAAARNVWIYDELVTREQTLSRNAAAMQARVPADAPLPVVYCDIAGRQANSQTGSTDERILRDAGFTTRTNFMRIEMGLEMITDLLEPASGPPRLFIDPKCQRLIEAMEGYRNTRGGDADKDGRHDHLIDALRYALVNHDRAPAKLVIRHY